MTPDYQPVAWDAETIDDCRRLIQLAVREDLGRGHDWTTVALIGSDVRGAADVVTRERGIVAGVQAAALVAAEYDPNLRFEPCVQDAQRVAAGERLATLSGSARSLLTCERPLLNLLGHLCGIATTTRSYVDAIADTRAGIYDTRKTMPGWRRLEKFAVRCGGGHNHRTGLFDAVLIKDNHLSLAGSDGPTPFAAANAVRRVREFLAKLPEGSPERDMVLEVEVDNLEQLRAVLAETPDVVLLDNMRPDALREAIALRDELNPRVVCEASGGVRLDTVHAIASSGVDRVSVGALTHSARWLDVGLDWRGM